MTLELISEDSLLEDKRHVVHFPVIPGHSLPTTRQETEAMTGDGMSPVGIIFQEGHWWT